MKSILAIGAAIWSLALTNAQAEGNQEKTAIDALSRTLPDGDYVGALEDGRACTVSVETLVTDTTHGPSKVAFAAAIRSTDVPPVKKKFFVEIHGWDDAIETTVTSTTQTASLLEVVAESTAFDDDGAPAPTEIHKIIVENSLGKAVAIDGLCCTLAN
jgi:hypothetical protein